MESLRRGLALRSMVAVSPSEPTADPAMKRGLSLLLMALAGVIWLLGTRAAYSHDPITTTVLFNREVVRIFERKCVQCHAANTLSMPLTTYKEARPWAQAIKEEVLERRMPPWPAVSGYGRFANENSLTTREMEYLISWIDGGVPAGAGEGVIVPPVQDWPHGTPDLVLTMPSPHVVAPDVKNDSIRVVIPTGLQRARSIRSVDFKPGDRRVVKSAFFYDAATGEWLGAWTPWHASLQLPDDVGFLLPAGARIAVDIHYHGAETPIEDISAVGLHFAMSEPRQRATTFTIALKQEAADSNGRIQVRQETPSDSMALALAAELGTGTKSVEVTAVRADGSTEVLLLENPYQPNWPTPYIFREPVSLPRGTAIVTTAYSDRGASGATPMPGRILLTRFSSPESR
jgi:hypothetical protein